MGTTAEKLQKALANKQSLVDIVNSKAGTSYTINSKPSDIVETINTKWSSGGSSIPGVSVDYDNEEIVVDLDESGLSGTTIYGNGPGIWAMTNESEVLVRGNSNVVYIDGENNNVSFEGTKGELYLNTIDNTAKIIIDEQTLTSNMIAKGVTLFGIQGECEAGGIEGVSYDEGEEAIVVEGGYGIEAVIINGMNYVAFEDYGLTCYKGDEAYIYTEKLNISKDKVYIDDVPLSEYGGSNIDGVSFDGQTLSVDTDPLQIGTIQVAGQGAHIEFTSIPEVFFKENKTYGYPRIYIDGKQLTSAMIAEGVTLFGITGTYKGNSSSATVEGNTLVVSGTVENNTLTLSSGSVENKTLKL